MKNKLLLLFTILNLAAVGQLPMTRSIFNSAYVPVNSGASNGGTLATISGDDVIQAGIPIGFTFNYLGINYTSVSASSNGWLSFLNLSVPDAANTNLSTTTTGLVLAPWWDDLRTDSAVYITQGLPGNQIFTFQWYSRSFWTTTITQLIRYQVKLYEGSNIIEFHYTPVIPGTNSTAESASIGIKSFSGGAGNFIDAFTGSSFVSSAFLSTTTKWPAVNYRFTPGLPTAITGGSYNVGVSQVYPNIQEAVADINHRGISGNVTLNLSQPLYDNTNSTGRNIFPVFFGPIAGTASGNSLTVNSSVGTSTLIYDGASEGSASNASNTNAFGIANEPVVGLVGSQLVRISNLYITPSVLSGSTIDRGIALVNLNAAVGTQSCAISNVTVALNRSNTNSIGIELRLPTTPTVAAGANSFNRIENYAVFNSYNGVLLTGNATFPDLQNILSTSSPTLFNQIGANSANDIGNGANASVGINATAQNSLTISNHIIQNITNTGGTEVVGISVGNILGVSNIHNNIIRSLRRNNATSTIGVVGIRANVATTGTHTLRIYNNFVSGLTSAYTGAVSATRQIRGIFVQSAGGGLSTQTISVDFNNVSIDGSASPNISNACYEIGTTTGPVIFTRNNIFANFTSAQTAPAGHFGWVSTAAASIGNTGSASNFNDLFLANTTEGYVGRGNLTNYATLANWQTAMTGQDAQSISCDPQYVNNNLDLHVTGVCINGAGNTAGSPWVTTDIDNQLRGGTPDIGADEFNLCSGATAGNINPASYTLCAGQGVSLNASGASLAGGISYLWKTSSSFNGPYNPVTAGSGSASIIYNTGTLTPGTYYFIHETTCSSASVTATSNTVTVFVASLPSVSIAMSNTVYCSPGTNSVVLTANGANTYTWAPLTGLSSSVGVSVNASPSLSVIYTVTGTDLNGCVSSGTNQLTVLNNPYISTPVAIPSTVCVNGSSQLNVNVYGTGPVNTYSFSASTTSSLLPLVAPSTVVPSNVDDTPMGTPAAIGFTFNYNGVNYTQFSASPDGWVLLGGATAVAQFGNQVTSTTNIPKLYPYWDDIATGTTGYVRTSLLGSAPSRTLVIEWFVTIPRNISGPANSTFQALLIEATGQVEFRYGNMNAGTMSASSGLTGGATNFNCVTISGSTNSTVTPNDGNAGQPANGVSYLFTPPAATFSWSPSALLNNPNINNPLTNSLTSTTVFTVNAINNICVAAQTVSVGVVIPTITAVASSSAVCNGNSATINASGASSYTWNPGNITSGSVIVTPSSNITYTVNALDANNCPGTQTLSLVVNQNPTVNISGNSSVCSGNSATLSANGADTFIWNTSANTASVVVTPSANTIYSVTGTNSLTGCFSSNSYTVDVLASPTIAITGNSSVCSGNSATLLASGADTFTWNTSANTASVVVTPSANTVYSVTGTNSLTGCFSSNSYTVDILPNPSITVTPLTSTICTGNSVNISASGAATYTWNTASQSTSINVSPSVTTVYVVSATGTNNCTSSAQTTVNVNALPSVSLTASVFTTCVNSGTIQLTGSPAGGTYSGSNVNGSALNPIATGTFSPVYSYTNPATGCSNTASTSIIVESCTGIAELNSGMAIKVYPNPNNGMFYVETGISAEKTIEVVDIAGRVVVSEKHDNSGFSVDISGLANGIYQLRILHQSGTEILKVIKQ